MYDLGLNECRETDQDQEEQGEEFNVQEALECQQLEIDDEAAQYYDQQNQYNAQQNQYYAQQNGNEQDDLEYFMGAYCSSDGMSIMLGVFTDNACSVEASSGVYEKYNYGKSLPYSSESIISSECISCKVPTDEDQNQEDENQEDENGERPPSSCVLF